MLPALLLLALQAAAPPPDLRISGSVGWGGKAMPGEPAPLLLDFDSTSAEDRTVSLRLTWAAPPEAQLTDAPAADALAGRSGAASDLEFLVPARSRRRLSLALAAPERKRLSLWVHARNSKGKLLAVAVLPVAILAPGQRLLGVVGRAPVDGLVKAGLEPGRLLPDELPEDAARYLGLHALLWIDGKADELRSPRQADALKDWIRAGGHFIVSRSTMAGFGGSAVAGLLPVRPGTSRELLLLDGLRPVAPPPDGRVVVLESALRRGRILLEQEEVLLAVDDRLGAGRVTFLAFDVAREPFTAWAEAPRLWTWLLGDPPPPLAKPELTHRPPPAVGSLALTRQAVEFPDVEPPRVRGLFLMIVLYIAVVGPFDYLLLRVLKRHEFTWITFPVYVAGFTALILSSGGAFIRQAAHQREIGVVDFHGGSSRIRAVSALLAPADGDYGLDGGAEPVCTAYLSRSALEDVMDQLKDARMRRGDGPARTTWPLARLQSAIAVLDAPGSGPSPLDFTVEGAGEKVRVRLSNRGGAYSSALLATSAGVYFVDAIPPGESRVEAARHYSSLDAFLQTHGEVYLWKERVFREDGRPEEPVRRAPDEAARRALIALSFPPPPGEGREVFSGLARRLDARGFVEAGGRVLLAWPRSPDRAVTHLPEPSRRSSVLLHRFFQEPSP